jgi:hypothetical protein
LVQGIEMSIKALSRLKAVADNPGQAMSVEQMLEALSEGLQARLTPFVPKELIAKVGKKKSLIRVGRPGQAKAVQKMLDGLDFVTTFRMPFGYVGGVRQEIDGSATVVHYENHTGVTIVSSSSGTFNP